MIPPFPSPPITASISFIFFTTFTSPTADGKYLPPCFSVISFSDLVLLILLTVLPAPLSGRQAFFYPTHNRPRLPGYIPRQTFFHPHKQHISGQHPGQQQYPNALS